MPSERRTSSKLAVNLAVSVADQKDHRHTLVVEAHDQIARLLGHPGPVRVGRDTGDAHAPARKLDEEQDVEALQEQRVDGKEIALDDARRLAAQKLPPARFEPPRRRLDARLAQDRPDGARRDPDAQPDQLALDAAVSPPWVLARQPQHQLAHTDRRLRTARAPVRIRPTARDQLAVPAQQRRRRDEERRPRPPRQHPTERSQQSPISRPKLRTSHLALEQLQLVTQHEILDLLRTLRAHPQHNSSNSRRSAQ
jgi:hypothetical protein